MAIPARSKVVTWNLVLLYSSNIIYCKNTAPKAPIKAKIEIVDIFINAILTPNIIAILAPRAAPDDMPIT